MEEGLRAVSCRQLSHPACQFSPRRITIAVERLHLFQAIDWTEGRGHCATPCLFLRG